MPKMYSLSCKSMSMCWNIFIGQDIVFKSHRPSWNTACFKLSTKLDFYIWQMVACTCVIWNMEDRKIILGMLSSRCILPISAYCKLHDLKVRQRSKVKFWRMIFNHERCIIEHVERDKKKKNEYHVGIKIS